MYVKAIRLKDWKSFADSGQVELGDINVLVGRNNSGKSAFLHGAHQIQDASNASVSDIRLRARQAEITFDLVDPQFAMQFQRYFNRDIAPQTLTPGTVAPTSGRFWISISRSGPAVAVSSKVTVGETDFAGGPVSSQEPDNLIYTYFAKRKVAGFDRGVDIDKARAVVDDLRYLPAKIDRLSSPGFRRSPEYFDLCQKVLGLPITAYPAQSGKQAGVQVGDFDAIPIEAMGDGVSSLLGLITNLCMADGHLFLIEEPENDIHPEGLKKLLDVIIEKSAGNQFIISTHSNVVVKHLGGVDRTRIFSVVLDEYVQDAIPTSTITPIENTPQARIDVLRQLGYSLFDFEVSDAWIIMEESSAQVIVRNFLIPWFAPKLAGVQIVSAGGVDRVEATFDDFKRVFLYAHLQPDYFKRAWVVVDGDDRGRKVVTKLRQTYGTWPENHFRTWGKSDFEQYYPSKFSGEVERILALEHGKKREPKRLLLEEVKAWCLANEVEAKDAFMGSAGEVIKFLKEVEATIFGNGRADSE